jgi:hypothetical protein
MAFPVLDERADVEYQRPHSKMKRKLEEPGAAVIGRRTVIIGLYDCPWENGR